MLEKIKQVLILQKNLLSKCYKTDLTAGGALLNFNTFLSIIDSLSTEQNLYGLKLEERIIDGNFVIEKRLCSLGQIGIICENNDPYILFKAILTALYCHNSVLVNLQDNKNVGTITLLAEIISKALLAVNSPLSVSLNKELHTNFVGKVSALDKILLIGERTFFNTLSAHILVPATYCPFGKCNAIILTNQFNDTIKNLPECHIYSNASYSPNYEMEVSSVKEAIDLISCSQTTYLTALFTDNKEDGIYFLNNCNSDFVLLNALPQINNLPKISQLHMLTERFLMHSKG